MQTLGQQNRDLISQLNNLLTQVPTSHSEDRGSGSLQVHQPCDGLQPSAFLWMWFQDACINSTVVFMGDAKPRHPHACMSLLKILPTTCWGTSPVCIFLCTVSVVTQPDRQPWPLSPLYVETLPQQFWSEGQITLEIILLHSQVRNPSHSTKRDMYWLSQPLFPVQVSLLLCGAGGGVQPGECDAQRAAALPAAAA